MPTTAIEYLVGCTINGVRHYYGPGILGRRCNAVRFDEAHKDQAIEIVRWLRERGYQAKLLKVRATVSVEKLAEIPVPIKKHANAV